ncbi:O-succinylbenzoic acid--CoA ligase [Plantibacter flavus]|uniref:O-succinylbenzoic acid--CoA ligase n=1 Tax=Plantibacter flavus TaxID=150123 RepID=A0A3N2C6L2_9MICO|nr:AMP-binding protein [Plantibacter flavus]ROR82924.1 O-succinylbenzoic acid--CoA ligase [Plantibacter flavus]SMG47764.1 O-succinylbenzoic acid--CoA ligase [Plantibacter flavus]
MTRQLLPVDASASAMLAALETALDGSGPAVLPAQPGSSAAPAVVDDRVALVIETSGSTGVPKRVALSVEALLASAAGSAVALGGPEAHRRSSQWILALPTHYIAGVNVLLRSIVAGTRPIEAPAGSLDARAFCGLVERLDADAGFAALVPAQLRMLVDAAETSTSVRDALAGLAGLLVGGQATPAPLLERSAALGIRVVRSYGSSETSGGCLYDGVPFPGVEPRLVHGELLIAGPVLAEGYLGEPDRTATAFPDDGGRRWYRTGDTAELVDGVVRVTGRADNVIISGGVNISLDRVQAVVRSVPGLAEAVVVAVPDERFGQASVIVTVAGRAFDQRADDALLQTARDTVAEALGRPARPARLVRLAELPLLASGKPDLVALRSRLG